MLIIKITPVQVSFFFIEEEEEVGIKQHEIKMETKEERTISDTNRKENERSVN